MIRLLVRRLSYVGVPLSLYYAVFDEDRRKFHYHATIRSLKTTYTVIEILNLYYWNFSREKSSQNSQGVDDLHYKAAKKLLGLFQSNGGVYIKFGQHLASLDYLIPVEYCNTMKVLFNNAPQSTFNEVKKVIEDELERPFDEIFESFNPIPIGAASLAQVHVGTLKGSREVVAVKIQHPWLKEASDVDIKIASVLFNFVKYIFPTFQFDWLAAEMKKNLPLELDFINEGLNAEKLRKNFKLLHDTVIIPKIYWKHTKKRILIMEYLDGIEVTDTDQLLKYSIDPKSVADKISKVFCKMMFEDKFLHCDPHPGNLLIIMPAKKKENSWGLFRMCSFVLKRNTQWKLAILDHGLYRNLNDSVINDYAELWRNILFMNEKELMAVCKRLNIDEENYKVLSCILTQSSWRHLHIKGVIYDENKNIEEMRNKSIMNIPQIIQILGKVPSELLLVFKTNDLIRNIEHKLTHSTSSHNYFINIMNASFKILIKNSIGIYKLKLFWQYMLFKLMKIAL